MYELLIEKIAELKKSTIFNLSLSSKELFHSNFIAWACNAYPKEFGSLLCEEFELNCDNESIVVAERESKNLDILIEFENKKLIIENKVKSSPNRQQLIDYRAKNGTQHTYVLLSLIKPNFDLSELNWQFYGYNQLSILINRLIDLITDDYHKLIIYDYSNFISILFDLNNLINFDVKNGNFDIYGRKYELFKDIRMHDFYIKNCNNKLSREIQDYLKLNLKDYKVVIRNRYSQEENKNQIVISTNFVRGKGVIYIEYSNEPDVIFGIMLDGGRYNQCISVWGDKLKRKIQIADDLMKTKKWFEFEDIPKGDVYPKKGKYYNKFGKNILYRAVKINSDQTLNLLFQTILKDLNKIIT